MQYDMERFEQPLVDETQPKAHVWTDIGQAEVEHSIFGKARVRVYRKQDEVRGAVSWTVLSIAAVVGVVWLVDEMARQPEIVYVAPPPVVAEPEPVVPVLKPRVAPKPVPQRTAAPVMPHSAAVAASPMVVKPPVAKPIVSQPAQSGVAAAPAVVVAKPVPVIAKPAPVAADEPLQSLIAPVKAAPEAIPAVNAQSAVSVSN